MPSESTQTATDEFGFPAEPRNDGSQQGTLAGRRGIGGRLMGGARKTLRASASSALIIVLLLGLLGVYFWQRIIHVIPSGHAGVLYRTFRNGTETDYVYPEGLHVFLPWDRLYDYDTKVQLVLNDITVLTNKGLPIELKLAIRYHPEYDMLGLLHQKVGPEYVQKIVLPQVESVLRRSIGTQEPESIYTNKEGVLTSIITKAIEETSEKYVTIDDIIIREVILPEQVRNAITEKLVYQQQLQAYEFRLATEMKEADRKKIEGEGVRAYQEIIGRSLSQDMLRWEYIRSQVDLAKSPNAKVVVMGDGGPRSQPQLLLPAP
jgi:regulator of protease activity HflC (stomatin/prohibitin superfamily)